MLPPRLTSTTARRPSAPAPSSSSSTCRATGSCSPRNDDYWGEVPAFDEVVFKPITADPSRVAALLAGDVDMINDVPTVDVETLKKARDDVVLHTGVSNRVIYCTRPVPRELALRHGQGRLADHQPAARSAGPARRSPRRSTATAIVDRVMEGQSIPAGQLLPEGFFGVSPESEARALRSRRCEGAARRGRLPGRLQADRPRSQRPLHQRCQDSRSDRADADPGRHRDLDRDDDPLGLLRPRLVRRQW